MTAARSVVVRSIAESDAEEFLPLRKLLFSQTRFMLLESDEIKITVDEQRARIKSILQIPNTRLFVAEVDSKLVGFLYAGGGEFRRIAHSAHIAVGLLEGYQDQGIGRKLFAALEAWAPTAGITRLELTVMVHNARALHLYEKLGFEIEGRRRCGVIVDGQAIDEFAMSKLL